MKTWEAIVIGVDFSDASRAALREAARLAHGQQCGLHVAHTVSLEKDYRRPPETSAAISLFREKVEEKLRTFCLEEIECFSEFDYHILVGQPFREICQLTRDINADLLVLGSCNAEGSISHAGPVATNCIRKAPVPVLLVRSSHEDPCKDILAAIDFSATSIHAAQMAAEIAFENQSQLHLVHVHEPLLKVEDYAFCDLAGHSNSRKNEEEREQAMKQLRQLKAQVQCNYNELSIETQLIHHSHVAEALTRFVRSNHVGLAVLGTRSGTGIRDLDLDLLLGTNAERLIHGCPCSVLTVKPDSFALSL